MKKLAFPLLAFFVFMLLTPLMIFLAPPARAQDASGCYTVSDADARTYCLAKARGDASMCYAITKPELRALCRAEVRK